MDRYDGYLFDFDYTLGDATDGIVIAMNVALERAGQPPADRESIRRTVGMHLAETFERLTGLSDPARSEVFLEAFRSKADEVMTRNTTLFPESADVLRRLKRAGARVGIVTTKYRYRIEEILRKFDIVDQVDLVVGGEDVARPKPDPEGLLLAITRLGLMKSRILYIGDSTIDAETASAAGVDFVGVTTGTTDRETLAAYPHVRIVDRLEEL